MKRITTDISRTLNIFKRVLSLVISDIPLSWSKSNQKLKNRITDEEMEEERQVFNFLLFQTIGTHNEFYQYGVIMMNCVKEVWKSNIQHLNSFSLCTDVWSVTKPAVHFQAVMFCFALFCFALLFRQNQFMSLLLDSIPISSTSAEELNEANKTVLFYSILFYSILMDYDIEDRNVFISSDGVHSNMKVYGNSRAECNSHKLDNIVHHFIWSASYPKAIKECRHG